MPSWAMSAKVAFKITTTFYLLEYFFDEFYDLLAGIIYMLMKELH